MIPDPSIFTSVVNNYLPEPQASLLNGIIFGIPVRQTGDFYYKLKTVGLIHIVVLSGSNISLLSAIIASLTRSLGKRTSTLLTIIMIIFFILFVGPQPPIVRAGCMGIITLIGTIYGRKTLVLYSMIISLIFIGIFWPKWLTGISLQLSYGATLGIILFGKNKSGKDDNKKKEKSTFLTYVKEDIRTSMSAQVFTTPLIFYYFKQVSFISPISNLLISWLIAPLMVFGLIMVILGKIHFMLGVIFSYVCYILLSWIIFVVETLAKVPFASVQF